VRKILSVIFIASLATLFLLLLIQFLIGDDIYRKSTESGGYLTTDEEISFYNNLNKEQNLVFIIGSSHIVSLNATIISNNISNDLKKYDVYNLGKIGDSPVMRLQTIEKILESKPKIILYGISFRDFQIPIHEEDVSLPKLVFSTLINNISIKLFPYNPQLLSLFSLKTVFQFNQSPDFDLNLSNITDEYTPFYNYNSSPTIKEFDEIKNQGSSVPQWIKQTEKHRNVAALKNIIEKSKQENIKLVLFTTPLHQTYLDYLTNSQKEQFYKLLSDFDTQYDVKIYDLTYSYIDNNIWQDASHISYHNDVTIFNQDISNLLKNEMNE
jgi:hypothetical protein